RLENALVPPDYFPRSNVQYAIPAFPILPYALLFFFAFYIGQCFFTVSKVAFLFHLITIFLSFSNFEYKFLNMTFCNPSTFYFFLLSTSVNVFLLLQNSLFYSI